MLRVWRFDDSVVRSHVIAETREEAIGIFDNRMGPESREEAVISRLDGHEMLPIDVDDSGEFVDKMADQWIEHHGKPYFL